MRSIRSFFQSLRSPEKLQVTVFVALLAVVSFFSLCSLLMAYKTDTVINNQAIGDDRLESDLNANILGTEMLMNLNGAMHRLLGHDQMNGVTRLQNGYLTELQGPVWPETLQDNAEKIAEVQQKLAERGIPFLYAVTPYKIQAGDPQLPPYTEDHTNEALDLYVQDLQNLGVPVLDLRQAFAAQEADPYTLFYRTDHHWNVHGGFFAYTQLAQRMQQMLGVQVDPALLTEDSFHEEVYPAWHLGTHGQRTGTVFAGGADDFSILVPDFETQILDEGSGKAGTFEEILLDTSVLQSRDLASRYTYDTVFRFGDFQSQNTGCGKKVLFLSDSMGRAVLPFLTLAFTEVRTIEAYSPQNVTMEYIEAYQPDIVVFMHYATVTFNTGCFAFPL